MVKEIVAKRATSLLMPIASVVKRLFDPRFMLAPRRGWIIWYIFAFVVAAVTFNDPPTSGNVALIYRNAALRWWDGAALYNGTGSGFIYPPQSAILFLSVAWLPYAWSCAAWRVLNVCCFALGTRRLSGLAAGDGSARLFTTATLITVPLCWSAARHGQMTLLMGGLMMCAIADLRERRWWRTAAALVLATGLKPLAIPLLMLAGVIYPRTSWRICICGIVFAVLPFLTQTSAYVAGEYVAAAQMIHDASQLGLETPYAQLFWSLRVAGWTINSTTQTLIQLGAAAGTLGICAWSAWRQERARSLLYLLTLSACYILLMSPRTENNTYALMAPALACFAAVALDGRNLPSAALLAALMGFMLAGHAVGKLFDGSPSIWFKPLVCSAFSTYVLCHAIWHRAGKKSPVDVGSGNVDLCEVVAPVTR